MTGSSVPGETAAEEGGLGVAVSGETSAGTSASGAAGEELAQTLLLSHLASREGRAEAVAQRVQWAGLAPSASRKAPGSGRGRTAILTRNRRLVLCVDSVWSPNR